MLLSVALTERVTAQDSNVTGYRTVPVPAAPDNPTPGNPIPGNPNPGTTSQHPFALPSADWSAAARSEFGTADAHADLAGDPNAPVAVRPPLTTDELMQEAQDFTTSDVMRYGMKRFGSRQELTSTAKDAGLQIGNLAAGALVDRLADSAGTGP
jgi:hypothetical protein